MTRRGKRSIVVAMTAAALVAGCGDGARNSAADSPAAQRIEGSWVVRLRLERLRFEQVAGSDGGRREVRGTIALVANHWLDDRAVNTALSNYGSYDLDFRRLGFDPRLAGQAPRVEAEVRGRDSVEIVFEPEGRERIRLRGAWASDSIVGVWALEADRTGGDAAGSFAMTRQRTP